MNTRVLIAVGAALFLSACEEDDGFTKVRSHVVGPHHIMLDGQVLRLPFTAPDTNGACPAERALGKVTRDRLEDIVEQPSFAIRPTDAIDETGSPIVEARFFDAGSHDVAGHLIQKGYAVRYMMEGGGVSWCQMDR